MRILFGGTFDPIHLGHMELAQRVYTHYKPSRFYFVPNFQNPHKSQAFASNLDRLNMVKAAISEFPAFPFEILQEEALSAKPSYTYLTVKKLQEASSEPIALIMGNEVFEGLPFWYEPKSLLEACNIILIPRDLFEVDVPQVLKKIGLQNVLTDPSQKKWLHSTSQQWVEWFFFPKIDFSSTEVRKEIQDNHVVPESLQRGVWEYIKQNHLYAVNK